MEMKRWMKDNYNVNMLKEGKYLSALIVTGRVVIYHSHVKQIFFFFGGGGIYHYLKQCFPNLFRQMAPEANDSFSVEVHRFIFGVKPYRSLFKLPCIFV